MNVSSTMSTRPARMASVFPISPVVVDGALPSGCYRSVRWPSRQLCLVKGDSVQEHVAPPLVEPTTQGSLADLPGRNAAAHPSFVAFSRKEGGRWVDVTAAEFDADVRAL